MFDITRALEDQAQRRLDYPDMPDDYWPDMIVTATDGATALSFVLAREWVEDGMVTGLPLRCINALRHSLWIEAHWKKPPDVPRSPNP